MSENEKELGRGIADAPAEGIKPAKKSGRLRTAAAEVRKLRSICGDQPIDGTHRDILKAIGVEK